MQGVYEIRNTVTGEFYIGKSAVIEKRWLQHIHELESGRHISQRFQLAWETYGPKAFTFKVLEIISDARQCRAREAVLIDVLQPAYNVRDTEYEVDLRRERALRVKTERLRVAVTYLPWLHKNKNETLSVTQIGGILGCSVATVIKLCDSEVLLGARRVPGKGGQLVRRIPREALITYIENESQALVKQEPV